VKVFATILAARQKIVPSMSLRDRLLIDLAFPLHLYQHTFLGALIYLSSTDMFLSQTAQKTTVRC
jgi:hypothetical protein